MRSTFPDRIGRGLHLNTNQSENAQYPLHSILQISSLMLDYIFPRLSGMYINDCMHSTLHLVIYFHIFFLFKSKENTILLFNLGCIKKKQVYYFSNILGLQQLVQNNTKVNVQVSIFSSKYYCWSTDRNKPLKKTIKNIFNFFSTTQKVCALKPSKKTKIFDTVKPFYFLPSKIPILSNVPQRPSFSQTCLHSVMFLVTKF